MKLKLAAVIAMALMWGCGVGSQSNSRIIHPEADSTPAPLRGGFSNPPVERNGIAPTSVQHDWENDPALMESVCASVAECRTTTQGLGI